MLNFKTVIKKIKLPFLEDIFVVSDLGNSSSRFGIVGKGITIIEPTIVGKNKRTDKFTFFGKEAKKIRGKTPEFIKIIEPLDHSVISDFNSTVSFIKYCISKGISPYFDRYKLIKPPYFALAVVAKSTTEIEQKAVEEVLLKAGATRAFLIEKPVAIAAMVEKNLLSHSPSLIVDLGGGRTEISIVSGGGVVDQKTLKLAGKDMDKKIANYIYLKHGIVLGKSTCEEIKIKLLSFNEKDKEETIRGKSLETRLPKSIRIRSTDVREALIDSFNQIIDSIKELLEISAPEIVNEVISKGIVLSGGVAKTPGIDEFFEEELKIKTYVPDSPELLTIKGLLKIGENKDLLSILPLNI